MSPNKTRNAPKRKNRWTLWLAIGIIAIVVISVAAYAMLGQSNSQNASPTPTPTPTATPTPSASTSPTNNSTDPNYVNATEVLLHTSKGDITIALRNDKPITTANFLKLVKDGTYNSTIFHRVIAGFMIQGGENDSANVATIPDEIGSDNQNLNGTIAMANTGAANSASSQFFINVADNKNLYSSFDTSYTVFGKVISGMNVVMSISNVPTTQAINPFKTSLCLAPMCFPK